MTAANQDTACVTVELFGHARLVCGQKEIAAQLPSNLDSAGLATALSNLAPILRGVVVDENGQGLMQSYTANLNGLSFVESSPVRIVDGDRIYVFSSQAGG